LLRLHKLDFTDGAEINMPLYCMRAGFHGDVKACRNVATQSAQRVNPSGLNVNPASSRDEYERRMHRVIEAIDRGIEETLDLASLAAVANFSPYHFHRVFAAWMGETLGDYVRRRRLELGAGRLAGQPRLPVLQVALSVGFGSGEAFSRAFKAHFGASPSTWRAQRRAHSKIDQAIGKADQARLQLGADAEATFNQPERITMNMKIIERQPTRVAYMRHTGPYGEPIGRFWLEQVAPWMAADGLMGNARYGISHDDPSITDPASCRYDACVEVTEEFKPSGRALTTTLPGGRYAVMPFKGNTRQVAAAWRQLLGEWLPSSRMQLDNRPCFEFYPVESSYEPTTGVFECQICIPVAAL
jgi:AraC family transcriptional regulator